MSRVNNFIVNNTEAERLKEMIFNRAREHTKDYTDDTQKEIMTLAHDTFRAKNNPFSEIAQKTSSNEIQNTANTKKEVEKEIFESKEELEIGFPMKQKNLTQNKQQQIIQEQIVHATIQGNMIKARKELHNKTSFMGALNFLNSKAAESIIRTRPEKFDVIM